MTIQDPNTYKLLTPGPLTSSLTVREEMLVDRCTWDKDYKEMTQEVRRSLLELAHADPNEYTTVLMQGSGTFGVELLNPCSRPSLEPMIVFWSLSMAPTPNACAKSLPITVSISNGWILLGTVFRMLRRWKNF